MWSEEENYFSPLLLNKFKQGKRVLRREKSPSPPNFSPHPNRPSQFLSVQYKVPRNHTAKMQQKSKFGKEGSLGKPTSKRRPLDERE